MLGMARAAPSRGGGAPNGPGYARLRSRRARSAVRRSRTSSRRAANSRTQALDAKQRLSALGVGRDLGPHGVDVAVLVVVVVDDPAFGARDLGLEVAGDDALRRDEGVLVDRLERAALGQSAEGGLDLAPPA